MTTYYKQTPKSHMKMHPSSGLDSSKSYNSILNELHDCTLTKAFMDNAIQHCYNTNRASLPIAPSLPVTIAPGLPVSPPFMPIAPSLSDTHNVFAKRTTHNEKGSEKICTDKEDDLFIPAQKDTLFWCFYIIKYGVQAYFTLGNRHFVVEKQEKIAAIELLRYKKELLKQHKIKPFTSVEEDLSHSPTIGLKTFFALLVANDLPVTYLHKETFVEVNIDKALSDQETHIVQYVRPNVYAYLPEPSKHKRITRIANKYQWDSIEKPVLAMTSYKSEELLELFGKLHIESSIPTDKKPTKKEIYDAVLAYFV